MFPVCVLSWALVLVPACDAGPEPCWAVDDLRCEGGEPCRDAIDCSSGVCADGVCEARCDTSASCAEGEACVQAFGGGQRTCRADCAAGRIVDLAGLVCEDGSVRRCDAVTDPSLYCDVCGCPSGERCSASSSSRCDDASDCSCFAPAPVGSPCTSHDECESRNCSGQSDSTGPRFCQVAVGQPCTSENCVFCDLPRGGGSVGCRQSCEGSGSCPGGVCLGFEDRNEFACFTECTDDPTICFVDEVCRALTSDPFNRSVCRPR